MPALELRDVLDVLLGLVASQALSKVLELFQPDPSEEQLLNDGLQDQPGVPCVRCRRSTCLCLVQSDPILP